MKNIIDLYEGILDDVDVAVNKGDKNLDKVLNIPNVNDFRGTPYNKYVRILTWMCPYLFEKYAGRLSTIKNLKGLEFRLYKDNRNATQPYSLNISSISGTARAGFKLNGWNAYIDKSEKVAEKIVIDLIEKLAHEPEKLDKLFNHADNFYKAMRKDIKNPLNDL